MKLLIENAGVRTSDVPENGAAGPARVLLIEDDPRAALWIGEMLRATWPQGLVVTHAERLGDATQELLDRSASCVLLDLSLLVAGSVAPVEQVRTAAPDVPIVVLADRADEAMALRAIRAGAQDYLVKSELYPALLSRSLHYAIERKHSEVQLAHMALHDPLTGLPNRVLFLDRLGVALDRSRRTNAAIAVLFLDVDNFKQINDTLGHGAGDMLLAGLADRLRGMLRPMDTVARFGGDEFTFLFEELASEREVVLIAERITKATSVPIRLEQSEAAITVSIGIAMVADPTLPPETAIREADAAMYRAKELGRARYELFDEASRHRALERLELEGALRHAVERAELRVQYQPSFSLGRGHSGVNGFEALVRWEHPDRGLITAAEFIPLAVETGIVIPIGEYVLTEALRQVVRWRRLQPDVTVSVNLSARELEDPGLATMLARALRTAGCDPAALILEVSERALNHNLETAICTLEGLKSLGVKLAIDDYGTGSSSLTSLRRLPVDALRIDRSFVSGLEGDPEGASIAGAVVELGHALGLRVEAEGVETGRQLAELRSLGCDQAQGFLLGYPLSGDEAEALLPGHRY